LEPDTSISTSKSALTLLSISVLLLSFTNASAAGPSSSAQQPAHADIYLLLSTIIGYCIVAGSSILKAPQIVKILANGNAQGINAYATYLEAMGSMQTAGFAMYKGMPFSAYGESVIVGVQNLIIVLLIWGYNEKIQFVERATVALALAVYA